MFPPDDDVVDAEVVDEQLGDDTVEPAASRHDEIEEAEVVAAAASPTAAACPDAALHPG